MNQMKGLLTLAWEDSRHEIFSLFRIAIGALFFVILWFAMFALNLSENFQPYVTTYSTPSIAGTYLEAFLMSMYIGFTNAVTTFIFLFIVICLFEYSLSFLYIAYRYDNKSWLLVNLPVKYGREIYNRIEAIRVAGIASGEYRNEQHRKYIDEEIHKLKVSGIIDELDTVDLSKEGT